MVGVALTWNATLVAAAQAWAGNCTHTRGEPSAPVSIDISGYTRCLRGRRPRRHRIERCRPSLSSTATLPARLTQESVRRRRRATPSARQMRSDTGSLRSLSITRSRTRTVTILVRFFFLPPSAMELADAPTLQKWFGRPRLSSGALSLNVRYPFYSPLLRPLPACTELC